VIDFSFAEIERFWLHELPEARHAGPYKLESRCLHPGADNRHALNIDLRKGVACCHTKCNGSGWNMVGWVKHWHDLDERQAMQYVLVHSGHPGGQHVLAWNVPLARPLSVTGDDFSLGLLAQNIERARTRIYEKARDAAPPDAPVHDADYKATGLWAYPAIRAVKLAVKHLPSGKKEMRWFALTPKGGWLWGLKKAGLEAPLYRAEEIQKDQPLWVLNGEKAVDRARAEGVNATCLPHGEGHWRDHFLPFFEGLSEVWWLADNDRAGATNSSLHTSRLARAGIAARLVALPDLPPKGDFWDWLEAGRSVAEATAICRDAPLATRQRIDEYEANRQQPSLPVPPVTAPEDNGQPPAADPPRPADPGGPDLMPFRMTDQGNSERLILLADGDIANCMGKCLDYHDRHWAADDQEARRYQRAIAAMRLLAQQAHARSDARMYTWALKSENEGPLTKMVKLTARTPTIHIPASRLDADPQLIPFQNAVYDLAAGKCREHRRADYFTRLFAADYRPDAPPPLRFLKVLWELMGGESESSADQEQASVMLDYLQDLTGYCATGYTREKIIILVIGTSGNNGKSLFLDILNAIFGDYAVTVDPRLFTQDSGYGDGNRSAELARTRGTRLIVSSEPRRGSKLSNEIIKRMASGAGMLSAAFKHRDPFSFTPTGKIVLECNHHPAFDVTDQALTYRICMVPFNVQIPRQRMDRFLGQKLLAAERDGIARWIVEGARRYAERGLEHPLYAQRVTEAAKEEAVADDDLDEFISDTFDCHPHYSCKLGEAYAAYRAWARKNDIRFPLGRNSLGEHLGLRPYIRRTLASDRTVRLHGITPKEQPAAARAGRDRQYKDDE